MLSGHGLPRPGKIKGTGFSGGAGEKPGKRLQARACRTEMLKSAVLHSQTFGCCGVRQSLAVQLQNLALSFNIYTFKYI